MLNPQQIKVDDTVFIGEKKYLFVKYIEDTNSVLLHDPVTDKYEKYHQNDVGHTPTVANTVGTKLSRRKPQRI